MTSLYFLLIVAGAGLVSLLLSKWGLWRTMVAVSIVASSLRAPVFDGIPSGAWYVLQYGSLCLAILSIVFNEPRQMRRVDRNIIAWLVVFLFFVASSSLLSVYRLEAFVQFALLAAIFIFLIVSYIFRWDNKEQIENDVWAIFLTLVFLQAVGLMGYLLSSWAIDPDYGRFTGVYSNANYCGMMAAIAIPMGLGLMKREKVFIMLVMLTILYTSLFLSGSRGSMLAGFVGALFVLSGSKWKTFWAFLPIMIPLLFLIYSSGFNILNEILRAVIYRSNSGDLSSGRFNLFAETFNLFLSAPLMGVGYRASELIMGGIAGHNVYLVLLADVGIVGFGTFLILLCFIISASKSSEQKYLMGVLLTVGVVELTESSIFGFGGPSALTAWLIAMMLAASGMNHFWPGKKQASPNLNSEMKLEKSV